MITAQRLHGGVVHDSDRLTKGFPKIETSPAFAEILRFHRNLAVYDRRWEPDGDGVVFPVRDGFLCLLHEEPRCESPAGREFPALGPARDHQLDVGTADVDDENLLRSHAFLVSAVLIGVKRGPR